MIIPLNLPPSSVTSLITLTGRYKDYPDFQYLCIDQDSYIIDARLDNELELSIDEGGFTDSIHIGRYCSLAHGITLSTRSTHHYTSVTTSPSPLFPQTSGKYLSQKGTIILQNDVWVGMNSTIMPGKIIRNGSIIAAGSHVVTDVPPYAIYGGNPARLIKYRFSPEIIRKLQAIQWWYWPEEQLRENACYFTEDVVGFCRRFYDLDKDFRFHHPDKKMEKREVESFLFFPYLSDNYSVLPQVIEGFISRYQSCPDKKLLLLVEKTSTGEDCPLIPQLDRVKQTTLASKNILCQLDWEYYTLENAEDFFCQAACLITNRNPYTARFTCLADRYDIPILHGTHIPIWTES